MENNVLIGFNAGIKLTTGTGNIYIGDYAGEDETIECNTLRIGRGFKVSINAEEFKWICYVITELFDRYKIEAHAAAEKTADQFLRQHCVSEALKSNPLSDELIPSAEVIFQYIKEGIAKK